jgi:hypothetical protein
MRPTEVFDRVLDTVRRYQANQYRIPAVPLKRESSGGPPRVGNWRTEYIAEFVLAGKSGIEPMAEAVRTLRTLLRQQCWLHQHAETDVDRGLHAGLVGARDQEGGWAGVDYPWAA